VLGGKKAVSFLALFKYSDRKDKVLMFFGSISSMGAGVAMPIFMIYFSKLADVFSGENRVEKSLEIAIMFFIIGGALWLLSMFI
jgi:hypothetical protein